MKHADLIKRLIREVLSTPPSEDKCNCGCHSCENVGNKGPVLNENLSTKITMTENMKYHVDNKLALTENTFRYGSKSFLNLWNEARQLFENKNIFLNDDDKEIVTETDLGRLGIFEGKIVPLDLIQLDEIDLPYRPNENILKNIMRRAIERGEKNTPFYEALEEEFKKNLIDIGEVKNIIRDYGVFFDYEDLLNMNESEKKKTPALGKPKRGGSKKFYVYVRDPKSKRIKKVSFGMAGGGLHAKLNNPKARQAFSKRHNCPQKKDKTKASYWSCRLPRYAKALGINTTFSGYW